MSSVASLSRKLLMTAALAALVLPAACSSSSSPSGGPAPLPTPSFMENDAAPAPNLIRMIGSTIAGNLITIQIAIGGQTTGDSNNLWGFAFDILMSNNTAGASFLQGSAMAGPFLATPPLFTFAGPSGADPNQIIVGITQSGPVAGNGAAAGTEPVIIELTFVVTQVGSVDLTFSGPSNVPPGCTPSGPEALTSPNGNCAIGEIFGAGGTITAS